MKLRGAAPRDCARLPSLELTTGGCVFSRTNPSRSRRPRVRLRHRSRARPSHHVGSEQRNRLTSWLPAACPAASLHDTGRVAPRSRRLNFMTNTSANPGTTRRRPPVWVFVSAAWLGPAVLAAFQAYMQGRLGNRSPVDWRSIVWEGGDWLIYALLTPIVFLIARRFPLTRERAARHLPLHLAAAILLCAAWAGTGLLLGRAILPDSALAEGADPHWLVLHQPSLRRRGVLRGPRRRARDDVLCGGARARDPGGPALRPTRGGAARRAADADAAALPLQQL